MNGQAFHLRPVPFTHGPCLLKVSLELGEDSGSFVDHPLHGGRGGVMAGGGAWLTGTQ